MNKNVIKVLSLGLIAILCISIITVTVTAAGNTSATVTYNSIGGNYVSDGAEDTTGTAMAFKNILGAVLTVAQVIGVGVAVIMLVVLAIKYISAAPSDKAEIKKHAVIYVVGAIVLFAASGILSVIRKAAFMINDNTK